jgi:hypothetical protein
VLERIGLAARARARKRTFQTLVDGLTDTEHAALDGLLATDPALRRSRFAWLRDVPDAPAPTNMVALLDRLDWVRGVGIGPERVIRVHPARLARLVEESRIMTAQHLAGIEPLRRIGVTRQNGHRFTPSGQSWNIKAVSARGRRLSGAV